jgi:hypothetical protein
MKQSFFIVLLIFSFITVFASCNKDSIETAKSTIENDGSSTNNNETMNSKIRIKIGASTFSATLSNNATAAAFKALLPMTINMVELNGNEKYFNLASSLPTNVSNHATIETGDLMLYGSNTFVLFYKTFSTSYSYTRLGRMDDTTGLSAALGNGNVSITFELQ